jgi:hypothetical protein
LVWGGPPSSVSRISAAMFPFGPWPKRT